MTREIFRHTHQLHQLFIRKHPVRFHAAFLFHFGKLDEAAKVIIKAVLDLHNRAIDEVHEAKHTYRGFAHAPGDGGTKASDYDEGPITEYKRMLAQEMDRRSQTDENNQALNIGTSINSLLGQPPQEEIQPYQPTPEEIKRGMRQALDSQQQKKAKGTIPAEWL